MINDKKYIELGTCRKPHGIKGEFSFHLYNPESDLLKAGSIIRLEPLDKNSSISQDFIDCEIEKINLGTKIICKLKGITDRNQVEAMIPFRILYPRENFPELASGEFYYSDLPGLEVREMDGSPFGKIKDYYENNGQLILVITQKDGKFLELPHVENFFPKTNIEEGFITIIAPEEM